jgi:3-hydroxyisobutyrate dehydrogenase-like beta-hydroxyacid dehydrogenase
LDRLRAGGPRARDREEARVVEDTVGLVGVGNMGSAMAGNLLADGYDVIGYDVDGRRLTDLERAGGRSARSPRAVLEHTDRVVLSLPSAAALHDVVSGDGGLLEAARDDAVLAETSTLALADKVRARDALAAAGMTLLDCPISGTAGQARERDMVFYTSGPRKAVRRFEPLLLAMGRGAPWLGKFGAGIKAKLVSNLLVSVHTMAAAEALNLAERAGLDPEAMFDVLTAGAGTSRMLEVRGPMMVERSYPSDSATVGILAKDVGLILEFAGELDAPAPLVSMVSQFFAAARGIGRGDADPAVLAEVYRTLSVPRRDDGGS